MKIRSAVPENGCLVFLWRTEKAKKQKAKKNKKKTYVKHIRIRLIGGCVKKWDVKYIDKDQSFYSSAGTSSVLSC